MRYENFFWRDSIVHSVIVPNSYFSLSQWCMFLVYAIFCADPISMPALFKIRIIPVGKTEISAR
jgi:hypothetical protein